MVQLIEHFAAIIDEVITDYEGKKTDWTKAVEDMQKALEKSESKSEELKNKFERLEPKKEKWKKVVEEAKSPNQLIEKIHNLEQDFWRDVYSKTIWYDKDLCDSWKSGARDVISYIQNIVKAM